ncbi:LysR family transcriptional regulator [Roseovarius faecimaris]|uniref:LysR family transcriptional regulator n=1 Tax=Roseovarius faecimaris TaxID=2494550 RepID=A0A6I6IRQ6_9RHOB|nr:LysR family transcriptional regulator [Roseovarius faecimaris]QGX98561.1 LysR family transcriptional regulator [Roseovarius faecimaris]
MPLRFTLRQLEYFVAVGEAGSIALASERVNVSSPSISAALSQLENEFGLQLFVRRHAHGLSLTQAGKQFMAQARTVLDEAQRLKRLAGDISGQVQGPLAVGCLVTFAQIVVPGLRREFEAAHPRVQIRQAELDQSKLIEQLRLAEIDVALTYDLQIPTDLSFIPLAELPPYALFGEDHPLARQKSVSIQELAEYPMVLLDLPLSSEYFRSLFSECGRVPKISERTQDMAVMRGLVANGFGYSIANIRPMSDRAPDGRKLCYVPLSGVSRPLRLGLLIADGAAQVLTVKAFIAHSQAAISSHSIPGLNMAARQE